MQSLAFSNFDSDLSPRRWGERQERVKVKEGWEGRWRREGVGIQRRKHPFANYISQAMKFLRLGAHQVHFKEKGWGEWVSVKADIYERWQFANISILDKPAPVARRSAAKLDESAANIYFIRTCPISTDGLIVWGERATVGLLRLVTLSPSAWSSPKCSNK